jgi:hypothetical protein
VTGSRIPGAVDPATPSGESWERGPFRGERCTWRFGDLKASVVVIEVVVKKMTFERRYGYRRQLATTDRSSAG